MDWVQKYRAHAAVALSDAESSESEEAKKLLLRVARAWLELAEAQEAAEKLLRQDDTASPQSERN